MSDLVRAFPTADAIPETFPTVIPALVIARFLEPAP